MSTPRPVFDTAVNQVADILDEAARTRRPAAPVRFLIGANDIGAAYAVQRTVIARRIAAGGVVVGRKIGLTAPAVQQQLGVDQPDFGYLFADMDVSADALVPSGRLLQPKAEAEIAFVLKSDLTDDLDDPQQVRAAVDYAVAALEIVDSRVADWDLSIADTVADNASSGLFVLAERRLSLDQFEPRDAIMHMYVNGQQVSHGAGSACLGDPLNALAWLARAAAWYGDPLRAGQIVLSGALGPMVATPPGTRVRAVIAPFGAVQAEFSSLEGS
ncbi:fumarylacetoacetate hydrolase family protein [Mycolicibacterium sp. BiH015]|uniref:2-keto-4-pentenoate hydratase n=1 Tax=Mycolicibacterium sp. BiH015 TaxID=3018808 RepID=UPI0022E3B711|nr:fumarylacetoacetate hydrolase family protein [Mycolicibacterium sp. BiH015]MDA2893241.1 fumarylacetoacetate hydrolase family protein [Mycolicibacterium sp. BiH015]